MAAGRYPADHPAAAAAARWCRPPAHSLPPSLCCRAEKFGTEYVEPAQRRDLRLDARKEKWTRPTLGTGFDMFTEEEAAKRAQRAGRFGLPAGSGLDWKPPVVTEDEEKKRQRAARFGVDYQPKDETGLMDVGEWMHFIGQAGGGVWLLVFGPCCRGPAARLALALAAGYVLPCATWSNPAMPCPALPVPLPSSPCFG